MVVYGTNGVIIGKDMCMHSTGLYCCTIFCCPACDIFSPFAYLFFIDTISDFNGPHILAKPGDNVLGSVCLSAQSGADGWMDGQTNRGSNPTKYVISLLHLY